MAPAQPLDRLETLAVATERARPLALAGERALPVLDALQGLLPEGRLRRGTVVAVGGEAGATALALALGAGASGEGSWAAAVGMPSLGLLAAAELGLVLERLVVIDPSPARWVTAVAALVDAVDLVYLRPTRLTARDARRLKARARERGAVLIPLRPGESGRTLVDAVWPGSVDVRLTVTRTWWTGIGEGGAGHLRARRVEVTVGGRGAATRERRVALWLPGPDGGVGAVPAPARADGGVGAG